MENINSGNLSYLHNNNVKHRSEVIAFLRSAYFGRYVGVQKLYINMVEAYKFDLTI